jgi:hypothetical protein
MARTSGYTGQHGGLARGPEEGLMIKTTMAAALAVMLVACGEG